MPFTPDYDSLKKFLNIAFKYYGYNSLVCFAYQKPNDDQLWEWRQIPVKELQEVPIHICKTRDYYITANTITGDKHRDSANFYSFHNLVVDIDNHSTKDTGFIRQECERLLERLRSDKCLPLPNFAVFTGRGMQLWYCLEELASAMEWLWSQTANKLTMRIDEYLGSGWDDFGLNLDYSATRNKIGYFRLPCSFNNRAGIPTELLTLTEEPYRLQELFEMIDEPAEPLPFIDYRNRSSSLAAGKKEPKENIKKKNCCQAESKDPYQNLQWKRKAFLEWLIPHRNAPAGDELRDKILFLYYNAVIQILPSGEAVKALNDLNQKFKQPMKEKEIKKIKKYLNRKNFLKFHVQNWLDFLSADNEEKAYYGQVSSKQNKKEERRKKYELVRELAEQGKNRKEIGDIVGLSQPTIRKILGNKITTEVKKEIRKSKDTLHSIAKKFHISSQTVWNIKNAKKYQEGYKKKKKERREKKRLESERKKAAAAVKREQQKKIREQKKAEKEARRAEKLKKSIEKQLWRDKEFRIVHETALADAILSYPSDSSELEVALADAEKDAREYVKQSILEKGERTKEKIRKRAEAKRAAREHAKYIKEHIPHVAMCNEETSDTFWYPKDVS